MRAPLYAAVALLVALPVATSAQTPPAMESMMTCTMHGVPNAQGMQGMQGMGMMGGHGQVMSGPAALLGRPVGPLGLTIEQTAELDVILARAREAALAVLTPEQRAGLEAPSADAEHQH